MSHLKITSAAGLLLAGLLVGSLSYGITEEVKVGSLQGVVQMEMGKGPLPNAEVVVSPKFELPDGTRYRGYTRTKADGSFSLMGLPAGEYEGSVFGKAHSQYDINFVVAEGKVTVKDVEAKMTAEALSLRAPQRVVLPGETVKFEVNGVARSSEITVDVLKVSDQTLARGVSLYAISRGLTVGKTPVDPSKVEGLTRVRSIKLPLTARDIEGVYAESRTLDALPRGIYLLRVRDGQFSQVAWFSVTDLALVAKNSGPQGLIYAVDIKSGRPKSGVSLTWTAAGNITPLGKTNSQGVLTYEAPNGPSGERVISAEVNGSRAFAWLYFNAAGPKTSTAFLQTDRPVYRPGDRIQFKGMLRQEDGFGWKTVGPGSVKVKVFDTEENEVYQSQIPVSEMGSFVGEITASAEALPGAFRIEVEGLGAQDQLYVPVLTYRKPEYSITVAPSKPSYLRGDSIRMKVKAEYFTGEPMVGGKVRASVYRRSVWMGSPFEEGYDPDLYESDNEYMGEPVEEVEATTNASGEAFIDYNTAKDQSEFTDSTDFEYVVQAWVSDQSGRAFEGSGKTLVTRGEIDLRAEFSSWIVDQNKPAVLEISAKRFDGGPAPTGLSITTSFVRERCTKTAMVKVPLGEKQTVVTNEKGLATASMTPDLPGQIVATVEARDAAGRRIVSESYVYVAGIGESDTDSSRLPKLKLIMGKKQFSPGEKARGLIQTDRPGGFALLTVEGENVYESRVIELKKGITDFELDNIARYAPGISVSAAYIKDKEFHEASTDLRVGVGAQRLNLEVTPDRTDLKPGEDVSYTIKSTKSDGTPQSAEVSLGVVDEGIYQIREDKRDPLDEFYQRRYSMVGTTFSFPELYLDGENKAPANMQVRRNFADTAAWLPRIRTDAQGVAKVKIKLPDNLTEWRATVIGATGDGKFGRAQASVVARKDLTARLSLPSFILAGDRQEVSGLVTNTTGQEMKVEVKLDGKGLPIEGEVQRTIAVPARSAKTVTWTLAPREDGDAKIQLSAWDAVGTSDALELPLNVRIKGRETVAFQSGKVAGEESFELKMDPAARKASLEVRVEPGVVNAISEAVTALIEYPYGCTEQTLSRFVPAIATRRLIQEVGLSTPEKEKRIDEAIRLGILGLKRHQHSSGAWGWWEYDEDSSVMTAAVLEGLAIARQSGADIPPSMIDRGLEAAKSLLAKPTSEQDWARDDAALAAAVLLHKPMPEAQAALVNFAKKARKPKEAGIDWLARVYLGLTRIPNTESLQAALYAEMTGQVAESESTLEAMDSFWGEGNPRYLQVLIHREADSARADKLIRTSLMARRGSMWVSTRDTSLMTLALAQYVKRFGLAGVSGQLEIEVNGKVVRQVEVKPGQTAGASIKLTREELQESNQVKVRAQGLSCFFTAELRQTKPEAEMPGNPMGGVEVKRTYHRLDTERMEDGTLRLIASNAPVTEAKSGEILRCRIEIKADKNHVYVLIEDPIPASCRIADSDVPYASESWGYWWDRASYFDDRAAFFRRTLEAGTHIIEYPIRVEAGGENLALPTVVSEMYGSSLKASSDGLTLRSRL